MSQWKKAWGYVPIDWGTEIGTIGNVTQKLRFRNNINGTKIKIKFTNLYDAQPFVMDHVTVGKWNDKTGKITEVQTVTYQGNRRIKAEAGCSLWSDEIPLSVAASDDLAVSVYSLTGLIPRCLHRSEKGSQDRIPRMLASGWFIGRKRTPFQGFARHGMPEAGRAVFWKEIRQIQMGWKGNPLSNFCLFCKEMRMCATVYSEYAVYRF